MFAFQLFNSDLLGIHGLSFMLKAENLQLSNRLRDITFHLPKPALVALIGPNGAGKSTLLQALAGLLEVEGQIEWMGRALSSIPIPLRPRTLVWQGPEPRFAFGFTVREVVAQARFSWGDDDFGVEEALEVLDLGSLVRRPVTALSDGERQRVLLARSLASGAPIQLWDEPLSHLDIRHGLQVMDLAAQMVQRGCLVLLSLHDLHLLECFDQVMVLEDGYLNTLGSPLTILQPHLLQSVFGVLAQQETQWRLSLPNVSEPTRHGSIPVNPGQEKE